MENIQDKLVRDVVSRIDEKMKEDFNKLIERALDLTTKETTRGDYSREVVYGWDTIQFAKRDQNLRDKYPKGYVMNCYIKPRSFDDVLFDNGVPTLNGYAIVPRDEYEEMKKQLDYYKGIADGKPDRW